MSDAIQTAKANAIALLKGAAPPVMKEMDADEMLTYAFDGIAKAAKWESVPLRLKALDGIQKSIDAFNEQLSKAEVDDGLGVAKTASSGSGAPGPDNNKSQWTATVPVQVDDDTNPAGKVVTVGIKKELEPAPVPVVAGPAGVVAENSAHLASLEKMGACDLSALIRKTPGPRTV